MAKRSATESASIFDVCLLLTAVPAKKLNMLVANNFA
jgi:hypothetical protein